MEGPELERLFHREGFRARVAYLNENRAVEVPPVELIQLIEQDPGIEGLIEKMVAHERNQRVPIREYGSAKSIKKYKILGSSL